MVVVDISRHYAVINGSHSEDVSVGRMDLETVHLGGIVVSASFAG